MRRRCVRPTATTIGFCKNNHDFFKNMENAEIAKAIELWYNKKWMVDNKSEEGFSINKEDLTDIASLYQNESRIALERKLKIRPEYTGDKKTRENLLYTQSKKKLKEYKKTFKSNQRKDIEGFVADYIEKDMEYLVKKTPEYIKERLEIEKNKEEKDFEWIKKLENFLNKFKYSNNPEKAVIEFYERGVGVLKYRFTEKYVKHFLKEENYNELRNNVKKELINSGYDKDLLNYDEDELFYEYARIIDSIDGGYSDIGKLQLKAAFANSKFSKKEKIEKIYEVLGVKRFVNIHYIAPFLDEIFPSAVYEYQKRTGIDLTKFEKKHADIGIDFDDVDGYMSESDNTELIEDGDDNSDKDEFLISYKNLNPLETTTKEIRRIISRVPKKDKKGRLILNSFGLPVYLQERQVFDTIIRYTTKAKDEEDFNRIIVEIYKKFPWFHDLYMEIGRQGLNSAFYRTFKRDSIKYYTHTEKGYSIPLNKANETDSFIRRWMNNIRTGNILKEIYIEGLNDSVSFYNKFGQIIDRNSTEAKFLLNFLHKTGDKIRALRLITNAIKELDENDVDGEATLDENHRLTFNEKTYDAIKDKLINVINEEKHTNSRFFDYFKTIVEDENLLKNLFDETIVDFSTAIKLIGVDIKSDDAANILFHGDEDKIDDIWGELQTPLEMPNFKYLPIPKYKVDDKGKLTTRPDYQNAEMGLMKSVAEAYNEISTSEIQSVFKHNGKQYSSVKNPSLMQQILKCLRDSDLEARKKYIQEIYGKLNGTSWFQYADKTFIKSWINDLLNDNIIVHYNHTKDLDHSVVLSKEAAEYDEWTDKNIWNIMLTEFYKDDVTNSANYAVPIYADSKSMEFVRGKLILNMDELIERLACVLQIEHNRMIEVSKGKHKNIYNLDKHGNKFQYFQELNDEILDFENENTKKTLQKYLKNDKIVDDIWDFVIKNKDKKIEFRELLDIVREEHNSIYSDFTKNVVKDVMRKRYNKDYKIAKKDGVFDINGGEKRAAGFNNSVFHKNYDSHSFKSIYAIRKNNALNDRREEDLSKVLRKMAENGILDKELRGYYDHIYIKKDIESKEQSYIDDMADKLTDIIMENDELYSIIAPPINVRQGNKRDFIFRAVRYDTFDTAEFRKFFYNHSYATSQIIMLSVIDPSFFKDPIYFSKRYKMMYSPRVALSSYSNDNNLDHKKVTEQSYIVIKDVNLISRITEEVKKFLKDNEGKLDDKTKHLIDKFFNVIKSTDGQGLRSLRSFKEVFSRADKWTEEHEQSYNNIINSRDDNDVIASIKDLMLSFQNIKPFTSGYEMVNGMMIPTTHKDSEAVLLAIYNLINLPSEVSEKMKGINQYMDDNNIDLVLFESCVKVGEHDVIDLSEVNTKDEVYKKLEKTISENKQAKHIIATKYYGVQVSNPAHAMDEEIKSSTQLRKIITANLSDDFSVDIAGNKINKEAFMQLFSGITVENVLESYFEALDVFSDNINLSKILQDAIRSYNNGNIDMIRTCSLNEKGNFNGVFYKPFQNHAIAQVLNSIIVKKIVKQKINGGMFIQLSDVVLQNSLDVRFKNEKNEIIFTEKEWGKGAFYGDIKHLNSENIQLLINKRKEFNNNYQKYKEYSDKENKSIAYVECYIPAYSKEFLRDCWDAETNTYDMSKIPEELLYVVGYGTPVEDKHSIYPMKIKGFLPLTQGTSIILPYDLMALGGFDFDNDKISVMTPAFYTKRFYDYKKALNTFNEQNPKWKDNIVSIAAKLKENTINENEEELRTLDDLVKGLDAANEAEDEFLKWFKINKDSFVKRTELIKYKLNLEKRDDAIKKFETKELADILKNSNRFQRNNLYIDMVFKTIINKTSSRSFVMPSNYETIRKNAVIMNIMQNSDTKYLAGLKENFNITAKGVAGAKELIKKLYEKDLNALNGLLEKKNKDYDFMSPSTRVKIHRENMNANKLIGIFAIAKASHNLFQRLGLQRLSVLKGYKDEKRYFKLNNNVSLLNNNTIDNEKNANGTIISENLVEFLTASVDNANDPLLYQLNINEFTASIAAYLMRDGYEIDEVSAFLNQPVIHDICDYFFNNRSSKYKSINNVVDEYIGTYLSKNNLDDSKTTRNELRNSYLENNFLIEDLTADILLKNAGTLNGDYYKRQIHVAYLLKDVLKYSDPFNDVVNATRVDDYKQSSGPRISDTLARIFKLKKIYEDSKSSQYPFVIKGENKSDGLSILNPKAMSYTNKDDLRHKLLNSKLCEIEAFKQCGLLQNNKFYYRNGDANQVLNPFFSAKMQDILETIADFTRDGRLSANTIDLIMSDVMEMNAASLTGGHLSSKNKGFYIMGFIDKFQNFLLKHPEVADLRFIKMINNIKEIKNSKEETIAKVLVSPSMSDMADKEQMKNEYISLFESDDEEVANFARELYIYEFHRHGFRFGTINGLIDDEEILYSIFDGIAIEDPLNIFGENINRFFAKDFIRGNLKNSELYSEVSLNRNELSEITIKDGNLIIPIYEGYKPIIEKFFRKGKSATYINGYLQNHTTDLIYAIKYGNDYYTLDDTANPANGVVYNKIVNDKNIGVLYDTNYESVEIIKLDMERLPPPSPKLHEKPIDESVLEEANRKMMNLMESNLIVSNTNDEFDNSDFNDNDTQDEDNQTMPSMEEDADRKEYNENLNNKIRALLDKWGIAVTELDETEKQMGLNGVTDFSKAKVFADGNELVGVCSSLVKRFHQYTHRGIGRRIFWSKRFIVG